MILKNLHFYIYFFLKGIVATAIAIRALADEKVLKY